MSRRAPDRAQSPSPGAGRVPTAPAIAATLLVALLVAGCGLSGGDEGTTTASQQTAPSPAAEPGAPPQEAAGESAQRQSIPVGDGRGGVRLQEIGSFESPLYVAQPPGENSAVYVVEQGGRIIRVDGDGSSSTFLDVSGEISSGGERGLLSVAFAPDFADSGRFYIDYTDPDGNTRVVEYRSPDGRRVKSGSRRELLRIDQPFSNHNGGLLQFGPDGLLYIGTGDGGSANDPQRNAQDLSSLLGKILRIDPRGSGGSPYSVPKDNPFTGQEGARGEVYSLGLRNPWRYSFDRETGALSIGDVGQNTSEEIDLVGKGDGRGANFGWSAFEAFDRFNTDQEVSEHVEPVLSYPTSGGNCSVTGGYVVRDTRLSSLYGRYVYGDFCLGELRSFPARPGRAANDDRRLGLSVENLSSFGEDGQGRIYATSLEGPVYRLEPKN